MRMTSGLLAIGLLTLLVCGPVWSQNLVIANARIIDGNGGVMDSGSVVVQDGRIASVSAAPADAGGAQVIDADGLTVMPGFIDAHRHVISGDPDKWLDEQAVPRMQEFLDAGFTTVLSAGDDLDRHSRTSPTARRGRDPRSPPDRRRARPAGAEYGRFRAGR